MIVVLDEAAPPVELQMPRQLAIALASSDIATVAPAREDGLWTVSAVRRVGVLLIGDHEVRIRPKLPIGRLMFLLGYSSRRRIWRNETVDLDVDADLLHEVAEVFLWHLRAAVGKGLLQGYLSVEEKSPTVRGRLDFDRQLRRRPGLSSPVEVTYDEFTVDIPENRLLVTALDRLVRLPQLGSDARQRVRAYEPSFAGVAVLPRGRRRDAVHLDRRSEHYRSAIALAELILDATSIEHRMGDVRSRGFLIDVAAIFEDFLTAALRDALEQMSGIVEGQHRSHLDIAGRLAVRPDIVWKRGGGIVAVMDAKYKAQKPSGYPHADVYQMLAYCTRFGLRDGHLIYAAGEQEPTMHELHGAGVRVHCHALNLDGPPQVVLSRVRALAQQIALAA